MAAQALYRKWRSQTFEELIGQEHVTTTLRNALRDGRVAHAYLFTGPRGTGKTSTARLLAKAVNCLNQDPRARPDNTCAICQAVTEGALLDLIEIDAASNRGIDEIRDLRDKVHFVPGEARFKVYVIDEVHMLTPEAFNALLKTLEEPPPHVIFVLATTEPHKIPDTVLSRCQRFDFRRIPLALIIQRLQAILGEEGRGAEPGALEMIARSAEGSMRDAISLTDQLLSYGGDLITEAQVQSVRGTISGQAISDLVDFLAAGDTAEGLALINQLSSEGVDLRQLCLQLVSHLRSVLLVHVGGSAASAALVDLSGEQEEVVAAQAGLFDQATLGRAIRLFNQAGLDMRDAAFPQLVLELAWLESMQPAPAVAESIDVAPADPAARPAAGPATTWGPGSGSAPAVEPVAAAGAAQPPAKVELPRPSAPVPDDQVVQTLRANWTGLLQAAEAARGGTLRGALRTLRNVVAVGSDVHFAFERAFSKTTIERPENKRAVEALLGELLGRPVRIHCQVGQEVVLGAAPKPPATAREVATAHDYDPEDPVVQHAIDNLGAVTTSTPAS